MSVPLLAFPVYLSLRGQDDPANVSPASDAFVLTTLFFLFFLIACFVLWAWFIWRRHVRPKSRGRLMDELEEPGDESPEPHTEPTQSREEPLAPWEKPADWWKK